MTPEQTELRNEIHRMNKLMVVFASIALVAGLVVLLRSVSYSKTPEGGFAGMALMFAWFLWVPFIFFPAVGVFMAWDRKHRLTARLSDLDKKDDDHVA
jgi:hypothetical protein